MANRFRKRQEREDSHKHKPGTKPSEMAKKSKKTPDIFDMPLSQLPNLGTSTSNTAAATLSSSDLRKAIEKLRAQTYTDVEEQAQTQQAYQSFLNAEMRQVQANLLNQLNRKGAGQSSSASTSFAQSLRAIQGASQAVGTPLKPMQPPKYLEGYKVTVRTGKTVWTVHHFEERAEPSLGRYVRYYYLEDENGRQTREDEEDLKVYENPAEKKSKVDFDTVVIAQEKREQILEALEQINQADLIFDTWGFGETIEKGKGVSMLFYGPPGTGKTLMAQAIANKLDYKLKVIATADIESSAPGEAERNIRKHFKEAKGGKTILLFDECDSLIYTRQNMGPIMGAQVNELLSQIERFNGITLFTTNRLGTLDEAVNRRLALKLEFDMPSQSERAEIWKRMFPKQCPLEDKIDWNMLASVEITGGYIKNCVLRAARMAAIEKIPDEEKTIKQDHLVRALRLEANSMIEFEDARENHRRGIGTVDTVGQGVGTVQSRDMTRGRGGLSNG